MSFDPLTVLRRAVDVHHRLLSQGIDNAIGGALALAFHVDHPRATTDIDINVSAPATDARDVLAVLPDDVPWDETTIARIESAEQVRILWPVPGEFAIPLDLFFLASEFHDVVRQRTQTVRMLDEDVKILSATDLTIFKALFARSKDWPDIEAMLTAHDSTVDIAEALRWVSWAVGDDDPRLARLTELAQCFGH